MQIKATKVMLIDVDGTKMGEVDTKFALDHAKSKGLDLVLVSPNSNPQVCKILDYGKYKFDLQKKQSDNKKSQKCLETKSVRLTMMISDSDLEYRAKQVLKFADKGYKVRVFIQKKREQKTRVRSNMYTIKGTEVLQKFAQMVSSEYKIEKAPSNGMYDIDMILAVMTKKEKELKNNAKNEDK